jgi:hypothetical protein
VYISIHSGPDSGNRKTGKPDFLGEDEIIRGVRERPRPTAGKISPGVYE